MPKKNKKVRQKIKQEREQKHEKIFAPQPKVLAILIGLPGSGKSYYAEHTLNNYYRISQDEFGRFPHYKKFLQLLIEGCSRICIDRVNFERLQRLRYVLPAKYFKYKIVYYYFTASEEECLKRMRIRINHPTINARDTEKHKEIINKFKSSFEPIEDCECNEYIEIKTGE
jgi:predicted kinase